MGLFFNGHMPVSIRQAIRIEKNNHSFGYKNAYFFLCSFHTLKKTNIEPLYQIWKFFFQKKIPTFSDRDSWFVYFVGSIAIKALRGVV
jgi:hypothetical protein